jgi:hypothetical protein
MKASLPAVVALGLSCALAPACSTTPSGPKKEAVLPLLQKEAEGLKLDGEKVDPALQVQSTWTIEGVEVTEQPSDPDNPWAGVVRFRIESKTKEFDGSSVTDQREKRFEYVYSKVLGKWIIKYVPSTPAPPKTP